MSTVQMIIVFALCIAVPLSALTWLITAWVWSRRYNAYQRLALEELSRMEDYFNSRVRALSKTPAGTQGLFDQDQP